MGRDESGTLSALKSARREIVDPGIAARGGRIVKTTGDGMLLEFPSVLDAVRCVVEVQTAMAARSADIPEDRRIAFRIGVNLGDIIIEGDDIFGDGVNVAARLQEIAPPGGVCVSSRVHDVVRDRLDLAFADGGEQALKNIARPVRVYRWSLTPNRSAVLRRPMRGWMLGAGGTAALVLAITAAAWWWFPEASSWLRLSMTSSAPAEIASSSSRPSIAVLPFANLSGDPAQEYFSDGMTEDIIVALGHFGSLTVMARNAVIPYKGKNSKPADVGRELNVRYLVDGSVRQGGGRVRVNVALTDTLSGRLLWSQQYDEEMKDLFTVQNAVARQVAGALAVSVTQSEERRALSKPAQNLDAYDLVLRGRELLLRGTRAANREARQFFERAIVLDRQYADAYAWNGKAYLDVVNFGWAEDLDRAVQQALEMGMKAVSLDSDSAAGHRVIGLVHVLRSEYDQASAEIDRVLAINPSDSVALQARAEMLLWLGHFDESIEAGEAALRFDPRSPPITLLSLGLAYYEKRRYADALRILQHGVARYPANSFLHAALAATLTQLDRMPEAAQQTEAVRRLNPFFDAATFGSRFRNPDHHAYLAEGLVKAGLK
jgi:TolB-like protein